MVPLQGKFNQAEETLAKKFFRLKLDNNFNVDDCVQKCSKVSSGKKR